MISSQLRKLLEYRQELRDLYEQTRYGRLCCLEDVAEFIKIAQRTIQIINDWPEDAWPLEDEENIWPDRPDLINVARNYIQKAGAYRGDFAFASYHQWSWIRLDLFALLYYFRTENGEE